MIQVVQQPAKHHNNNAKSSLIMHQLVKQNAQKHYAAHTNSKNMLSTRHSKQPFST